ncbi:DnaJ C-terminal domain-containing protein [Hyphomicrobium sp.]|uniref:DnaJ C-terminal domain-containing protein n=1 Tax=Hyphomicrobium sp. TaxID=82 RepID=UPI0025C2C981|nr:DnaJ C-terminal domain-containing protein [Hyphomicrobium sp.]MCC7253397.1 DnaJ domain-containing protein [Hyphomicrobium sp.]
MADDPYEILGVPHSATDDQIRKAYLKLVKELHPDVNPSKTAEERFKKVTAAHDIIGDPERRRQYDTGEIDASGEPRRPTWRTQGAGAGAGARGRSGPIFEDFGDMFSDIFSGAGRGGGRGGFSMRGRDVRYTLDVDFIEAVQGAKKRVTLTDNGVLDLTVPEGVADGQVLRLRGRGEPGVAGGESGDALVEIRVRAHREFRREGDDILVEVPITIDEAVLGGKVEVPTVGGRVQLTIPKGTSSGQVLRLKGKGVRNATTGATGDELVTVRIVLPETIDDTLSYFLSEWRQKHRYDPRK